MFLSVSYVRELYGQCPKEKEKICARCSLIPFRFLTGICIAKPLKVLALLSCFPMKFGNFCRGATYQKSCVNSNLSEGGDGESLKTFPR